MDTLLHSQPAGAGVSPMLTLALWAAAIIFAVVATVQRARGASELREKLRELEQKLAAPAVPVAPARGNSGRATPSFGATFYESSPSPLQGLLAWPGAVPTVLAAVLAVGGAGLMVAGSRGDADDGAGYRRQLSGLQASHDSLAVMVKDLRDSLRVVAAAPTAVTVRKPATAPAEPTKPLATAMRSRSPQGAAIPRAPAAPAVLPAAPALDAGGSGAIPKAPVLP
jgi:hypothetical protein